MPSHRLIVARYMEDVEWVDAFGTYTIYNKGKDNLSARHRENTISLINVGREAHSYIYHIIENYDRLEDILIFCQGNYRDHLTCGAEDFFKRATNVSDYGFSINIGRTGLTGTNHRNFTLHEYRGPLRSKQNYDLGSWWEQTVGEAYVRSKSVFWNAIFSVKKEFVLKRSRESYMRLLKTLDWSVNPMEAHFCERTLFNILNLPLNFTFSIEHPAETAAINHGVDHSAVKNFISKWSGSPLPNKDIVDDYVPICKNLMFEDEDSVKKCTKIMADNVSLWAKKNCKKDFGDQIMCREDLQEKEGWYVESLANESLDTQTSGSTTGHPFAYKRWQKFFDNLEWDNHYNLVLDEFGVKENPEVLYFFSSNYKTNGRDFIFKSGTSELSMNNHGNNRSPNVHYVNYDMYKERQEEFFVYLFDYLKDNPIDVFFSASPQVNSMCHYIRKFSIRHKLGFLLSQTNERLLQEDAKFLFIDNNYFEHICDHMRCWDGGASFFTCKFGNYHLMDNLSWCEDVEGKLVCTDYFSLPSPFVKYWNGDMCKIESKYKRCECGRLYREFEFLENRPFSLKGICMRDIKDKIKSLNIYGIKQVRCSASFLDVVSERELSDHEKTSISSVADKFSFRFQVEDNKPYRLMFKDYETYKDSQIKKNEEKLDKVGVSELEIVRICEDLKSRISPSQGLCHGVRNGYEVMMFRQHLRCTVLGTDISHTAKNFPYVMVHDFHQMRPEWKNKFDFVYSNSLDHSYDPGLALEVWASCLKLGGILYLEHTDDHNGNIDFADCFSADFEHYKKLVQENLDIVDVINLDDYSNESLGYLVRNIKVILAKRSFLPN